ncbi:hypothetical protein HK099_005598 [Clydaea vesicula]|uniref:Btz domain-containing protein n=1 Tax=Clydaea vesicula TaxID=447962 RepID=A0AAD5XXH4_9FUNG|nr:hypothetical protein HK099_005598 [Clydaea vesicula]KAJ3380118.1 hypothetical protein HDU92_006166 [Lobulomyces angularis]
MSDYEDDPRALIKLDNLHSSDEENDDSLHSEDEEELENGKTNDLNDDVKTSEKDPDFNPIKEFFDNKKKLESQQDPESNTRTGNYWGHDTRFKSDESQRGRGRGRGRGNSESRSNFQSRNQYEKSLRGGRGSGRGGSSSNRGASKSGYLWENDKNTELKNPKKKLENRKSASSFTSDSVEPNETITSFKVNEFSVTIKKKGSQASFGENSLSKDFKEKTKIGFNKKQDNNFSNKDSNSDYKKNDRLQKSSKLKNEWNEKKGWDNEHGLSDKNQKKDKNNKNNKNEWDNENEWGNKNEWDNENEWGNKNELDTENEWGNSKSKEWEDKKEVKPEKVEEKEWNTHNEWDVKDEWSDLPSDQCYNYGNNDNRRKDTKLNNFKNSYKDSHLSTETNTGLSNFNDSQITKELTNKRSTSYFQEDSNNGKFNEKSSEKLNALAPQFQQKSLHHQKRNHSPIKHENLKQNVNYNNANNSQLNVSQNHSNNYYSNTDKRNPPFEAQQYNNTPSNQHLHQAPNRGGGNYRGRGGSRSYLGKNDYQEVKVNQPFQSHLEFTPQPNVSLQPIMNGQFVLVTENGLMIPADAGYQNYMYQYPQYYIPETQYQQSPYPIQGIANGGQVYYSQPDEGTVYYSTPPPPSTTTYYPPPYQAPITSSILMQQKQQQQLNQISSNIVVPPLINVDLNRPTRKEIVIRSPDDQKEVKIGSGNRSRSRSESPVKVEIPVYGEVASGPASAIELNN